MYKVPKTKDCKTGELFTLSLPGMGSFSCALRLGLAFCLPAVAEQKEFIQPALAEPNARHWELLWRNVGYLLVNDITQENGKLKLKLELPDGV